ncbi:MAG: TRAP-type transport system protein [Phycisphaerales bacterium]|nr:TRAP-type transport system protein [Phycisphaerales bacterium]
MPAPTPHEPHRPAPDPSAQTSPAALAAARRRLHERVRKPSTLTWDSVLAWWPWATIAAVLLAVGWLFVKPAPPKRVVLAAGPAGSAYLWFADKYAKTFAAAGVTLDVRQTFGSVDNYRRLDADAAAAAGPGFGPADDGVSVALVQSGTCPDGVKADLRAVASLYLEPVWVFYRGPAGWQLPDLAGKRVAVGPDGSGTRSLAARLLAANQIPFLNRPAPAGTAIEAMMQLAAQAAEDAKQARRDGASSSGRVASATRSTTPNSSMNPSAPPATAPAPTSPVAFIPLSDEAAADALRAGRVDAAVFVCSPRHPQVAGLLSDESLRLMSFERHEAYARVFPFLSDVKLPRGTVDLARDLPRADAYLLAPAANLVCREGTHPAIVGLLLQAAAAAHERGDLLSRPGVMPNTQFVEFPVDAAADAHFRHGPPLLQRLLPFRLAAFVDRMKVLLLPLVTLAIPLARLAPPVYVWRMRARTYRWYRVLREIDQKLRADLATDEARAAEASPDDLSPANTAADPARFADDLAALREMEKELADHKVPLSYMSEVYNLRLHTDYLRRRIDERLAGTVGTPAAGQSATFGT